MKTLKLLSIIFVLVLLTQFTSAESYENNNKAKINLELKSEITLTPTGSNAKLLLAEATLNLIPLETNNQEILDINIFSEPKAEIEKENDKIIFQWDNIRGNQISYGVEADIQTKNTILKVKDKIRYPTKFDKEFDKYLQEEKYINLDQDIKSLANELFLGENDLFHAVYKTADWIEENIDYIRTTETETQVKTSSWVLEKKFGVCDELTNLFISILRYKGIPTKFITGIVYSSKEKKFENHGWAEVYFPNYGWLPFDLTYSQYGWLDVTHIKLAESLDSGIASIDYHWKSTDLDSNIKKLDINAKIKEIGENLFPILTGAIEPYETRVGFGSYVPIKVTIENPTDFYMTPSISLIKSPKIIGRNRKIIFLNPNSIKSRYFIVKVPSELDENYLFKSQLESEITFGTSATSTLEFSSDYPIITKAEAEAVVEKFENGGPREELTGIEFDCNTKETTYYEDTDIEVLCTIKNKEKDIKSLKICLANNCNDLFLTELAEQITILITKSAKKLIITAEDAKERIKYSTIDIDLIEIPSITINNIEPLVVNYNEKIDLKVEIESVIPAYKAIIYLEGQEILNTDILKGKKQINIHTTGKDLIKNLKFKMTYKDRLGKEYEKTEKYFVTVKNRPWYTYIYGWML